MLTVPDVVIDEVRFPSILSEAVAPESVKLAPTIIVIDAAPVSVITGGK